jgi:spore coat protein H
MTKASTPLQFFYNISIRNSNHISLTLILSVFLTLSLGIIVVQGFSKIFSIVVLFVFAIYPLKEIRAQIVHPIDNNAFLQNEVASVYVIIDSVFISNILNNDSLDSNTEYPAQFIYQSSNINDTISNIGFRLRGNTSRYADKKSFKVSFNTFTQGQKWNGLEKMNLNGEHNDPSILRSYLSAYLLKSGDLISPRNSYVKLYINNEYKGLYLNVEHIDEEFIQKRLPNDEYGNLYKASYGADLTYLGSNASNYYNLYELKTNESTNDYSGLINFLNVLNNTSNNDFPCAIQEVLDVESYLKTLAIEVLCGHWDGHSFNKNNFYLYQRPSDSKFMLIQYDMDNTFGIDWMSTNWANRNIYDWSHPSQPRPLYERMMNVPFFKDRFTFYIDEMLQGYFNNSTLIPILESKQNQIEAAALADNYRELDYGFSDSDFQNSLIQAWGGHVSTSIASFLYNRNTSANNQLIYQGIENPCPLYLEEIVFNQDEIEGYYDVTGKRLDDPANNQVTIVKFKSGKTEKIVRIE